MADSKLLIDGLSIDQFKALMSPIQEIVRVDGKFSGKKVNWFMHSMHVLANFFVRLFYAIFVTHRWESDLNLQERLWNDLNSNESKSIRKLPLIKEIYNNLVVRFPQNNRVNES